MLIQLRRLITCLAAMGALGAVAPVLQGQIADPLVRFNFSGGSLNNSGSLGGSAVLNAGTETTPSISLLPGGGYAFDNTGASGMGSNASGTLGSDGSLTFNPQGGLDGLLSFSVTGWFFVDEENTDPLSTGAYLMNLGGSLDLRAHPTPTTARLATAFNYADSTTDSEVGANNASILQAKGTWVFFALTYDGTVDMTDPAARNSSIIYALDADTRVIQPRAMHSGTIADPTGLLMIGNKLDENLPTQGLISDFRIYGSTTDGSGSLSWAEIETHVIPEPSTYAGLFGLLALMVCFVLRKRRK